MSLSQFTQADYEVIAREYAFLKEVARKRCADEAEFAVVQKAFDFANEAHRNVRRRSGEPYMLHPIAVAKIVCVDIGLGYKSIAAALLHDVVEDTHFTSDDIRSLFGEKIASIVDGLTKIKTILDSQNRSKDGYSPSESIQAENLKRILLTLNEDVRIVLIKLADRLHNCRTIEFMPAHKRDKILSETMFIFIPLAHRLGLYGVKSEMENIWLRYKEPDAYNEISALTNRDLSDKGRKIDKFIEPIRTALENSGFDFEVRKRIKTPYSIWHKMRTKNVSFEQVYDLYAVRIVFNPSKETSESERDQCYHIFSIITGLYRYKPDRVRDWVKHPKSNGYEALHCTLMGEGGMWIEVQIRSRRMDDIAEKGIAAHWVYKKDGYIGEGDSAIDQWLQQVKEVLLSSDLNTLDLLDIIHNDMTASDIMVFTPAGEQKTVQKGYTALDFAYQIHTEVGNHAIAAKANMRLVPLSYVLKGGDQIEIITAEDATPKKEWLTFLQGRHAKAKCMDYFRSLWGDDSKTWRVNLSEKLKADGVKLNERIMRGIVAKLRLSNTDELLFRYSIGQISYSSIAKAALQVPGSTRPAKPGVKYNKEKKKEVYIINSSADKHKYIFSDCCRPIAGDPVIGFLTEDGSIMVHSKTCPDAQRLASKFADSIVMPEWANTEDQSFLVRISLVGIDRMGLISDITKTISVMGLNIAKLGLNTGNGLFDGFIDLYVHDKNVLEELRGRILKVNGIQSVRRTEI